MLKLPRKKNDQIIIISFMITINYQGSIYFIDSEPYESLDETYSRGWFILHNLTEEKYENIYSKSIIMMNEKKGMNYT